MSPSDAASGMSERWRKVRYDSGFAYRAQAPKRWQVAGFTRRERPLPGRLTRRIPPLLSNAGTCILPRLMHALWFMLTALAVLASRIATTRPSSRRRCSRSTTTRRDPGAHPARRQQLPPHQPLGALRPSLRGHHRRGPAHRSGARGAVRLSTRATCGSSSASSSAARCTTSSSSCRSVRRRGRSLAEIARDELGPVLGLVTGGGHPLHRGHRARRARQGGGRGARRVGVGRLHRRRLDPHRARDGPLHLQGAGRHRSRASARRPSWASCSSCGARAGKTVQDGPLGAAPQALARRRSPSASPPTASSPACSRCGCCSARAITSRATSRSGPSGSWWSASCS